MRKKIISAIIILCTLFSVLFLVSCDFLFGDPDGGNGVDLIDSSIKKYNDNITYRLFYTSDEECPNGIIDDAKLHKSIDFEIGEVYYMVVDFTVSSFNAEGWDNSFSSSIKISPSTAISATLEEAATGNFTEKEEDNGTRITTTYSIPENRDVEHSYRIAVKLVFNNEGLGYIDLMFYGDGENVDSANISEEFIGCNATVGLKYELNEDKLSYSVVGIGTATDKDIIIPLVCRGLPVNSIGIEAFRSRRSVESIIISDGVTLIGEAAFADCDSLTSITIPNSVTTIGDYVFSGCSSLTSITIPNSVTTIGERAFSGCSRLTSITIPDSVTEIDSGIFSYSGLMSITIPDSVTAIGSSAFFGCDSLASIKIPDGVTTIGDYVFAWCSSLINVTIPDNVTTIGKYAFRRCSSLTSLTVPNSVTSLGDSAFRECSSLTSITIPESVTTIGDSAFRECSSLTSITIPSKVTSIGSSAFEECSSLESLTVQDGNSTYHSYGNCIIETESKTLIVGCKNSVIPDNGSVTTIGDNAFYGCSSLPSITIPDSVTSIGRSAFRECSSLTSITIPDSVTFIGVAAFYGCSSLTSATFKNTKGWKVSVLHPTQINRNDLANSATAAELLKNIYIDDYWERS